jgi:hypothetical protein
MKTLPQNELSQTFGQAEGTVAAASRCPAPDCGSLVLDYRPADSLELGHPQDWEFTCWRCGTEFIVPRSELIFQSIPRQWLAGLRATSHGEQFFSSGAAARN